MKADYKNWMPKGMVMSFLGGAVLSAILFVVFGYTGLLEDGTLKNVLKIIFLVLTIVLCCVTIWSVMMYRAFSYDGKRQMSRQIIEGIADYVKVPAGGTCLDVGCGSGALSIAVAKRNPEASIIGVDRWGAEYASYSKQLCENNAKAEGVSNTRFQQGDATHLEFPDETFDAVTSNYVYHNIPSSDRQAILLETLRTLKKGGTFAIHDIMSQRRYGNMQDFVRKLKEMGYQDVQLIDTTDGMFMKKSEALWMDLSGSTLLVGKK